MQATWCDIDSKDSGSKTFENARYEQNGYLTIIASIVLCMIVIVSVNILLSRIMLLFIIFLLNIKI